jgi:hypothetical protein
MNCWLKDDALEHPLLAGTVRGAMAVVGATGRVVFCGFGVTVVVVVAIVGTGLRVVLAAVVGRAVVVLAVVVVVRVVVVVDGFGAAAVVVLGLGWAFGFAGAAAVGPDGLVITLGAAACVVVEREDAPATAVGLYPQT